MTAGLGALVFEHIRRHSIDWFARAWHGCVRDGSCTVPNQGPAILVANHPSHADPAFLMATCPRPLCFLQARECYDIFLLRRLFQRAGCIPVSRDRPDLAAIRTALERLGGGEVVCLFPQGEVANDHVGPGKCGAALLALRSQAPVIPVRIRGGPRGRSLLGAWLWPSADVHVAYGPPIVLSAYRGRRISRALLGEATAQIMAGITAVGNAAQVPLAS